MRTLGDLAWKGVCIFTDPSGRKHVIPKRFHALVVTWSGRPDLRVRGQKALAESYLEWRTQAVAAPPLIPCGAPAAIGAPVTARATL